MKYNFLFKNVSVEALLLRFETVISALIAKLLLRYDAVRIDG